MPSMMSVPHKESVGLTIQRGGQTVFDSAYEESSQGRLKQFEVWVQAMLEATRVFATVGADELDLQLKAMNESVERINRAIELLVEAKVKEEFDGV